MTPSHYLAESLPHHLLHLQHPPLPEVLHQVQPRRQPGKVHLGRCAAGRDILLRHRHTLRIEHPETGTLRGRLVKSHLRFPAHGIGPEPEKHLPPAVQHPAPPLHRGGDDGIGAAGREAAVGIYLEQPDIQAPAAAIWQ